MANRYWILVGFTALMAISAACWAGQVPTLPPNPVLNAPRNPSVQSAGPIVKTPHPKLNSSSKSSSALPPISADRLLWGPYMNSVMDRLYKTWIPPIGSKGKSVIVRMTIARSGQLVKARIVKPSGLLALDEAALKRVLMAAPFQTFPLSAKESTVEVEVLFDEKTLSARSRKK